MEPPIPFPFSAQASRTLAQVSVGTLHPGRRGHFTPSWWTSVPWVGKGTVSVSGFWPDVVSLGLGVLAVAVGAWYSVDKWAERARRYQAVKWDGPSGFEDVVAALISPHTFEAEGRTGAEEILTASPGPVADRLVGGMADLVSGTSRATDGHRSIKFAATACVLLVLTCLVLVLGLPILLLMVLAYVSDSGHDFRLRIIVVLFAVDIALQVIANV